REEPDHDQNPSPELEDHRGPQHRRRHRDVRARDDADQLLRTVAGEEEACHDAQQRIDGVRVLPENAFHPRDSPTASAAACQGGNSLARTPRQPSPRASLARAALPARAQSSYLNETCTFARYARTWPSSICRSSSFTSAMRRSRSDLDAFSTAAA